MYITEDSKLIREIKHGNNFGYILENHEYFKYTDYKVLQSQKNDVFIPCMKMLFNGMTEIYYLTDEYMPITAILSELKSDSMVTVMKNLLISVLEVKSNGFLASQNVVVSWEKVYVDTNTWKVKLVYLPINQEDSENYGTFINELRSNMIRLINNTIPDPSEKLKELIRDLSNGSLTLADICNKTKVVTPVEPDINLANSNTATMSNNSNQRTFADIQDEEFRRLFATMKIVSMNTPERVEIVVNKDEIVVGKKRGSVDVLIEFNKMISRQHCKIARRNKDVYIIDLESVNGTYLNQKRLDPLRPVQIKKGDMIRLANMDFQVV